MLLTGFRGELVERFVRAEPWPDGVSVRCHDGGLDTPTGGRVWAARSEIGDRGFCLTYADGLADIDLRDLLDAHRRSGALATVTVVWPQLQFGFLDVDQRGRVLGFEEKPRSPRPVNGGFMVFERAALDYFGAEHVLERQTLPALASAGVLHAYPHEGFWACLDTYKDRLALEELWGSGAAPWAGNCTATGRN